MKFKNIDLKRFALAILIPFFVFFIFNKAKQLFSNQVSFPAEETITINLSEIPQIPWDTSKAVSHVIETFTASVNGCLISRDDAITTDELKQNSLIERYYCEDNICQAFLKKNVYFHNKREVTAYDVEFSILRALLQRKKNYVVTSLLNDIVGIEELKNTNNLPFTEVNSINYPTGLVKGIEVVDNYNIIFKLKWRNKFFLNKISIGRIPIVPIEELDKSYTNWKKYPIGFGKYKVEYVNWEKYEFILKKFNRKENIPKYIRFIFSSKDEGDIKILLGDSGRGKSGTDRKIIFPNIYSNGGFLFNFRTELGKNKKFREAISLALDREKIADTSLYKEIIPEDQMIPAFSVLKEYRIQKPLQKQNIERAKQLLNSIPHSLWKNKVFHVHTYWANIKNINSLPYIQEIKKQLADVGIQVKFYDTDLNYPKFSDNDSNVLWWTGFGFSSNDPNKNFSFFKTTAYYANEGPKDSSFDSLYELSIKNINDTSYYAKKMSEYFYNNNIFVVVLNQKMSFAYNSERLSSLGEQHNGVLFYVWKLKLR
ncbi:ABC transporter substrate-binding protein [Pigmentibacter ruber]|uniref:ABC transporter substrate-binding protein n=1 Tax=Pigmentibacter ruber TaxID=2683196 RepID=UPI00131D2A45|nr:ABC transporter substrate-binding protein [Pigmentibacter ruber]